MDIYGELKISSVLNIIERLQILNILEICYLYNLLWKYVKKYVSIQASNFLFVSSALKEQSKYVILLVTMFDHITYQHICHLIIIKHTALCKANIGTEHKNKCSQSSQQHCNGSVPTLFLQICSFGTPWITLIDNIGELEKNLSR
jgi:hypothetical protein